MRTCRARAPEGAAGALYDVMAHMALRQEHWTHIGITHPSEDLDEVVVRR